MIDHNEPSFCWFAYRVKLLSFVFWGFVFCGVYGVCGLYVCVLAVGFWLLAFGACCLASCVRLLSSVLRLVSFALGFVSRAFGFRVSGCWVSGLGFWDSYRVLLSLFVFAFSAC